MKMTLYESIEMPWCLLSGWAHCRKGKHNLPFSQSWVKNQKQILYQ